MKMKMKREKEKRERIEEWILPLQYLAAATPKPSLLLLLAAKDNFDFLLLFYFFAPLFIFKKSILILSNQKLHSWITIIVIKITKLLNLVTK